MNTPKHTPGPWIVESNGNEISGQRLSGKGPIAYTYFFSGVEAEESRANAQLIAAAP